MAGELEEGPRTLRHACCPVELMSDKASRLSSVELACCDRLERAMERFVSGLPRATHERHNWSVELACL